MRTLGIILAIGLLAGCANLDSFKAAAVDRAQQSTDRMLEDAIWVVCKATPIGAIKRRFGMDPTKYNAFCAEPPILPEEF